jgi:hypothetical protein
LNCNTMQHWYTLIKNMRVCNNISLGLKTGGYTRRTRKTRRCGKWQ